MLLEAAWQVFDAEKTLRVLLLKQRSFVLTRLALSSPSIRRKRHESAMSSVMDSAWYNGK
jgi:hypothetical protein